MSLANNNNDESGLGSLIPQLCKKGCGFFGRFELIGYNCRCGNFYCPTHRYPEIHACSYDYKSVGRDMTATSNPLVKQDKLMERI
ncbi:hypothetical protein MKX01_031320 [Papaver californicum]|nr:hypothetical protein MKX01_031320 [Papaver californicum]